MSAKMLLPESETGETGVGPEVVVEAGSKTLLLTLGITRIFERDVLDVSVWGSEDGREWRHLAAFPRKFYCGVYSTVLDLGRHPEVRYLRAHWNMARWDAVERKPSCGFYLHAEDVKLLHAGAA